jgi:hypothetical protein
MARKGQRSELEDEAISALRAAVSAGWNDAARTLQDPDLMPLRDRSDFRQLIVELYDRTFPDDPFDLP